LATEEYEAVLTEFCDVVLNIVLASRIVHFLTVFILSISLCSWYLGHCREEAECSPEQLAQQIFVHLLGECGDRAHSEQTGVFTHFFVV